MVLPSYQYFFHTTVPYICLGMSLSWWIVYHGIASKKKMYHCFSSFFPGSWAMCDRTSGYYQEWDIEPRTRDMLPWNSSVCETSGGTYPSFWKSGIKTCYTVTPKIRAISVRAYSINESLGESDATSRSVVPRSILKWNDNMEGKNDMYKLSNQGSIFR